MIRTTLSVEGRHLTVFPKDNEATGLAGAMASIGVFLQSGKYRLPVSKAGELLKVEGVHFSPNKRVVEALQNEVTEAKNRAVFLERLPDNAALYPFQEEGVRYLWKNPTALLFDEMGLGKTVQALMSLAPEGPVLVVCPASLKTVWFDECKKWRPDLEPVILEKFRHPEPGEMCIINYARLPSTAELNQTGKAWPGTTAIFDEAHKLKNGRAQRTMKARVIVKRLQKTGGLVWLLTGTPLQNKPQELWSLLVLLGNAKGLYGSYKEFALAFGGVKDSFGWEFDARKVKPHAVQILKQASLRRERVKVLPDLPTKTYRTVRVPAPDDRELLETISSVDLAILDLALDENEAVSLEEVAFLSASRKALAQYKVEHIKGLLESFAEQGEPVVVFSAHRDPILELGARHGWVNILGGTKMEARQDAVSMFQEGFFNGIAATIQAAGEGLTLTRAHNIIFLDRTFVPTANAQAEDRVCRIGQNKGVIVTDLVCDHALDYALAGILRKKTAMVQATTGELARPTSNQDDLEGVRKVLRALGG